MRYAIYLTPPQASPLADAAAAWLGRSPFGAGAGAAAAPSVARPEVPARYGFHATLRAPFHLADGVRERDLLDCFARHAALGPVLEPVLHIRPLSRFLAFRSDDPALGAAARATLAAFEPLRALPTDADRARRRVDMLDARGLELFDAWGYPYVMERYVFHMTLSGPLETGDVDTVLAAARAHFGPLDGTAHRLVHAVYREDAPGEPFTVIATQGAVADETSDLSH